MSIKSAFGLATILTGLLFCGAAQAQGKPPEAPAQKAPEGAPPAAGAQGDVDAGTGGDAGEPMELAPPKTVNLDMSALGQVNAAKDLSDGGVLGQEKTAAEAVESWTEREMDILEIHGYFRVRPQLFDNLNIRGDNALYAQPPVESMTATNQEDGNLGEDCREPKGGHKWCHNSTLAGANMRFRLEPTLNVSEEVWVKSQIDLLDNVMLGSTPRFFQNFGDTIGTGQAQGWDMDPPTNGDMIRVRRAWGEVMTPLGQIRFGRMGDDWGLGLLHNAGNGLNDDFGDSVDRLMFAAKINNWILAPAFDFPNEGVSAVDATGRPFDVEQLDDAYQLAAIVAYKHDAEEQLAMLKRGELVLNTGVYFMYRSQVLSFENPDATTTSPTADTSDLHFYRRDMWNVTPDFWFQLLYDTFHLELEAVFVYGHIGNPDRDLADFDQAQALTLLQYGGAIQSDYGLLSDQLRIGLEVGFASSDKDVEGLRAPANYDQLNNPKDTTFGAFAFNPSFSTDFIMYRQILGSISQSYYFHPWLSYDFLKSAMGKKMGLRADVLYSRAVYERSTISNNSANLGVELDGQVYFVSEDHFHAGLQYGVLFPLGAYEGTWDADGDPATTDDQVTDNDLSIPQAIQVMLGITY
ncbi:MAG: TIGR04551 family protein [Deltaproteobacteria bacterium]|nr:TIGR04551 family protein [Deltaproteobacteria bacterium]